VVWVARRLRAGPRLAGLLALLSVLGFVVLARPSPSVLRAAVMGGLGLIGLVLSRPRAALTGLAGAVLVLLLIEPGLAAQAGFELSVFATLGLLIFAPGWRRVLARRMPDPMAAALAVPAAAQVACAPLIAMIGGGTSVVAVPANLLAAPAVGPATVFGVLSAAIAPIAPWLARGCAHLGGLPCAWLLTVAQVGSRLPFASIGWPAGVSGGLLLVAVSPFVVLGARRLLVGRAVGTGARAGP
jgi:competence protein ComEC